ncbi:hypothetical protein Y1Q_0006586 [Alligator mississippiensis]|uniref:Uncharacterized protein n=1 Tax=Alligator mississippiensis TaxID=8496 RepID=A0A151NTH9_ALLMI|nr:hypothetical protein Y1Q_0006586 [Alligator mississippiensis]
MHIFNYNLVEPFTRGICLPLWLVPYGAKFCLRYGCVHLPLKSTDAVCIIILEGSWKKLSECKATMDWASYGLDHGNRSKWRRSTTAVRNRLHSGYT